MSGPSRRPSLAVPHPWTRFSNCGAPSPLVFVSRHLLRRRACPAPCALVSRASHGSVAAGTPFCGSPHLCAARTRRAPASCKPRGVKGPLVQDHARSHRPRSREVTKTGASRADGRAEPRRPLRAGPRAAAAVPSVRPSVRPCLSDTVPRRGGGPEPRHRPSSEDGLRRGRVGPVDKEPHDQAQEDLGRPPREGPADPGRPRCGGQRGTRLPGPDPKAQGSGGPPAPPPGTGNPDDVRAH